MNDQRDPRRLIGSVHPTPDFLSKHRSPNCDCCRRGFVGRRIFHARRLFLQLCQHVLPIIANLRESCVTGRVSFALVQQQVHRARSGLGVVQWHFQISRRDRQQDRAAHVLRMLPQVNQRRARSIRQSEKINPVVTQPGAHVVQIIHCDRRCIFGQVCAFLQRLTHFPDVIDRIHLAQVILRCLLPRNREAI